MRRFGIEADVELDRHQVRVAAAGDRAAHHHQARDVRGQLRIHAQCQREVGQRRQCHQRQRARVLAREPDDGSRRMFGPWRARRWQVSGIPETIRAVHEGGVRPRARQRRRGAGKHGHLAADDVEELERVADQVRQRHVAGDDGESRDIRVRMRHQDGQRIVDAGVGVDQEPAAGGIGGQIGGAGKRDEGG